ncbi:hypothetical protein PR048_021959 [Dryococelus australis]|uniref:Uncharacterized protein n=1 Tax=Dryococelus australis TaxID=614101 RepID=A0ABQ9GZN7_9NEOP|nr:hypothetical protein PR048_021959 [Dryococelus australis]
MSNLAAPGVEFDFDLPTTRAEHAGSRRLAHSYLQRADRPASFTLASHSFKITSHMAEFAVLWRRRDSSNKRRRAAHWGRPAPCCAARAAGSAAAAVVALAAPSGSGTSPLRTQPTTAHWWPLPHFGLQPSSTALQADCTPDQCIEVGQTQYRQTMHLALSTSNIRLQRDSPPTTRPHKTARHRTKTAYIPSCMTHSGHSPTGAPARVVHYTELRYKKHAPYQIRYISLYTVALLSISVTDVATLSHMRSGCRSGVVVRLLASHLGQNRFDSRRSRPRISAYGNHAGRCSCFAGFFGIIPFPPIHYSTAPYSPRFTLIGSHDLDVKSCPNLFTHSAK